MTISLQNSGQRFESTLKTFDGIPFKGTILPRPEGSVRAYDFADPRLIVRVRHDSRVRTGAIIVHPNSQLYLLANYDDANSGDVSLYRTHVMFPLNREVRWQRESTTVDPLTQLAKGSGKTDLGMLWVLVEQGGRERMDLTLRVAEEVHRVLTNADLQLGDIIDDQVVKRVDTVMGIKLAEIQ